MTTDLFPGAVAVTGVTSACLAIDTIIDQGEGTLTSPLEVVGTDVAHYYRFAEIVHGRRLVRNPDAGPGTPPDQRYVYADDPVPVQPAAVSNAPLNPKMAGYPAGSAARQACTAFNYTYTGLLKTLQAVDMMAGKATGGAPVGPSFEWQPTG